MAIVGHIKSVGTNTQRGEIHKNGGKFKTEVIDKKVGTDELLGSGGRHPDGGIYKLWGGKGHTKSICNTKRCFMIFSCNVQLKK